MIFPNAGYGGGYGGYGGGYGGYGYEYGCVGYFTVLVIIFGMLICFCCAFSGLGYAYWKQKSKFENYNNANGRSLSPQNTSFMPTYTV
uniref:Uncharacterized protein n=1 Tax=Panagrolaimus sp. ES5 TaxID=591445 RepID=A0AC34GF72_9BILA